MSFSGEKSLVYVAQVFEKKGTSVRMLIHSTGSKHSEMTAWRGVRGVSENGSRLVFRKGREIS